MDSSISRSLDKPTSSSQSNLNLVSLQPQFESLPPTQSKPTPPYIEFDQKPLQSNHVTDTSNRLCPTYPREDQFPALKIRGDKNGCGLGNAVDNPLASKTYNDHSAQTMKLEGRLGVGSGVMVAKDGPKCMVLTADHLLRNSTGASPEPLSAARIGAGDYPATIKKQDPANDLAVLAVDMGGDADAHCKPVDVATNPNFKYGDDVVTLGYPMGSRSVYASPSKAVGTTMLSLLSGPNYPGSKNYIPGENANRIVLGMDSQTLPGDSGGPTFDAHGKLVGILVRGNSYNESIDTLVDQKKVNELLK